MLFDTTGAVERERWNELQRNADRYRLYRRQADEQRGRRNIVHRRRSR